MGWVNDNGGIKSLGGAKLVPVVGDCGSTVEGTASAMERICRDPEYRHGHRGLGELFHHVLHGSDRTIRYSSV